jgi:hypothetical protein
MRVTHSHSCETPNDHPSTHHRRSEAIRKLDGYRRLEAIRELDGYRRLDGHKREKRACG